MSRKTIRLSKEQLDTEIRNIAKGIAHHGPDTLIQFVKERTHAALDPAYAEELCRLNGWKGKSK